LVADFQALKLGIPVDRDQSSEMEKLSNFNLNENHLMVRVVNHIVLHASGARIRLPGYQGRSCQTLRRFQKKFAVGLRYYHVVVTVNMPTGLGARGKSPLGNDYMFV
jgi:hypothetical protein